jgi:hypothetical protein
MPGTLRRLMALQQIFDRKVECVGDAQHRLERHFPPRLNALPERDVIAKICRHVHLRPALGFAQGFDSCRESLSELLIVIMHSLSSPHNRLSGSHAPLKSRNRSHLFSNDIPGLRRAGAAATEAMVPVD